ncbi:MAG: DUF4956 domain-containing protein [Eubacteriales bacterium]
MNDFLLNNLTDLADLNFKVVLLNNLVTVATSVFIMLTYRITYTGTAYSKKFNVSLGMMTIVTTFIMSVISNNIALSLGMVGALSIIRFRTAVKDVRDTTFIFWGIAVGISCGVSQYLLAAITSVVIFIFLMVFGYINDDEKITLVVLTKTGSQNAVQTAMEKYFGSSAKQKMKNADKQSCELVYETNKKALEKLKKENQMDIVDRLLKIDGVINVNQSNQSEDISR